ncbi:hypothetical protein ABIF36_007008 [Bradyrhizobium japonicum]
MALDVGMQRLPCLAVAERLDPRAQDRKRRAQLMRGIRGELALHAKAVLEAIERLVHGGDERHDLARDLLRRQADVGARRADIAGLLRGLPQRRDRTAEDDDVGREQDQQDRDGDPPDPPEEVRDDVVDDDVAVRKILGDADAHRPALDHAAHAGTGNRLGQARRGGIAGLSPRREQHASLGIANVVLVAAIGFRIEALQTVGQIEGQRAVRLRDDALGEHLGLGAHGIAVQLVDLRVEQPEQHQRQEDRNHRDRHDMQEHDARDQRFERRPGE